MLRQITASVVGGFHFHTAGRPQRGAAPSEQYQKPRYQGVVPQVPLGTDGADEVAEGDGVTGAEDAFGSPWAGACKALSDGGSSSAS